MGALCSKKDTTSSGSVAPPPKIETKTKASSKHKFYYFEAMGRAEPLRILMNHTGFVYEETSYTFETWP